MEAREAAVGFQNELSANPKPNDPLKRDQTPNIQACKANTSRPSSKAFSISKIDKAHVKHYQKIITAASESAQKAIGKRPCRSSSNCDWPGKNRLNSKVLDKISLGIR